MSLGLKVLMVQKPKRNRPYRAEDGSIVQPPLYQGRFEIAGCLSMAFRVKEGRDGQKHVILPTGYFSTQKRAWDNGLRVRFRGQTHQPSNNRFGLPGKSYLDGMLELIMDVAELKLEAEAQKIPFKDLPAWLASKGKPGHYIRHFETYQPSFKAPEIRVEPNKYYPEGPYAGSAYIHIMKDDWDVSFLMHISRSEHGLFPRWPAFKAKVDTIINPITGEERPVYRWIDRIRFDCNGIAFNGQVKAAALLLWMKQLGIEEPLSIPKRACISCKFLRYLPEFEGVRSGQPPVGRSWICANPLNGEPFYLDEGLTWHQNMEERLVPDFEPSRTLVWPGTDSDGEFREQWSEEEIREGLIDIGYSPDEIDELLEQGYTLEDLSEPVAELSRVDPEQLFMKIRPYSVRRWAHAATEKRMDLTVMGCDHWTGRGFAPDYETIEWDGDSIRFVVEPWEDRDWRLSSVTRNEEVAVTIGPYLTRGVAVR